MAILLDLVSLVAIFIIFISPYLVIYGLTYFNLKYRFLLYVLIQIMLLAIEVYLFSWWVDYSNKFLIEYYGYNWDGMNEHEIYANVLPENMSKVESLERSLFGIGWPVKAMFGFVMFIPYILVAYLIYIGIRTLKIKTKRKKIVIGSLIILNLVLLGWFYYSVHNKEFDSDKWKKWEESEDSYSGRYEMINSLTFKHKLVGKSKEEIISLLGKPEYIERNVYIYYLGFTRRGINTGTLHISFDNKNHVSSYKIVDS